MKVETVKIDTVNGPVTINKSDFDPAVHKLWKEPEKEKSRTKTSAVAVPKVQPGLVKDTVEDRKKAEEPKVETPRDSLTPGKVKTIGSSDFQKRVAALKAKKAEAKKE